MQAYTELIPPTAVTHAVSLPFISPKSFNLIVAKGSLLQVFSLKAIASESTSAIKDGDSTYVNDHAARRGHEDDNFEGSYLDGGIIPQKLQRTFTSKLMLETEYPVAGIVNSLARLKINTLTNGTEALLVGVKDAKISLLAWDPSKHTVSTVSIHYYEAESLQRCPWAPDLGLSASRLTVDPSNRCVALKFGTRSLAIIPFHQAGYEDLEMDDFDAELNEEAAATAASANGKGEHDVAGQGTQITPYRSSFVLSLALIDPNLVYPIDLCFLHEYREPTFGVLSSTTIPSVALAQERRDVMTYNVFTLDLEQRASTTLLSVPNLPSDLSRIVPLPPPVGGSLLIGVNEILHIDQAGKTSAIAVNKFARRTSNLGMTDQSSLELKLEFCEVEHLGVQNGDILLILESGQLCVLSFRLDGRTVSGLSIRKVDEKHGGTILTGAASCCSNLGRGRLFVGGDETDASLIGWTRRSAQRGRKGANGIADDDLDDDAMDFDEVKDYDDDLYENGEPNLGNDGDLGAPPSQDGDYVFRIHHTLTNLSPLLDMTIAQSKADNSQSEQKFVPELALAAKAGSAGSLTVLNQFIKPTVTFSQKSNGLKGVWAIRAKRPAARGMPQLSAGDTNGYSADSLYDRYVFISQLQDETKEGSSIAKITPNGFEPLDSTKYEGDTGPTIDVGVLSNGTRVVQIFPDQIQSFDGDLGLVGILPMTDEATGAEPKVVSASFADPYVLVVRDDYSIFVVECDAHGELEEVERGNSLLATQWISGCLYKDIHGSFSSSRTAGDNSKEQPVYMLLLTANGGLHIYKLPNLSEPVYVAEGLGFLHPTIQPNETSRRSAIKETLTEVLVADIGDTISTKPYLVVRNASECLTLYEPFHDISNAQGSSMKDTLRFNKISNPSYAARSLQTDAEMEEKSEVKRSHCMRHLSDIGGYSLIFIPGNSGRFLMKTATTLPTCLDVPNVVASCLSGFHTAQNEHSWIQVDATGSLSVCKLPRGFELNEIGWASRTVELGEEIQAVEYFEPEQAYVVATNRKEEFELPKDDDHHKGWSKEELDFKPLVDRSTMKLLSSISGTIVDTFELEPYEVVLTMKALDLEISEVSKKREKVIIVGTSISQGTDLPARGTIYAFQVIPVVPWPEKPETGQKLKLLGKEAVKGAVTSISAIGREGFFLAANGQKCMVRGLKEDGTMLPVAFLDAQTYVSVARALPGTGLFVVGDAIRGLWLAGYKEDPYKIAVFGKSTPDLEIVAADFIPEGNALYVAAADADMDLHIFQYDPENPKSLSGQRLLPRSTFHMGQYVTGMRLLPSLLPFPSSSSSITPPPNAPQQILITTRSGAVGLLQPLPPTIYATLSALATHLNTTLEHVGGLNPRGFRQAVADGMGGRVVLDGGLLRRYWELGCGKRADLLVKVGAEGVEVQEALRWVGGLGLPF